MQDPHLNNIVQQAPSPCFVVDLGGLRRNLAVLGQVKQRTGAKVLLAQKAFSLFHVYPLIRETLDGVCASGPWEARLGREEFGKEVHTFAAAYSEAHIHELLELTDHLVFNSVAQWKRFRPLIEAAPRSIDCAFRINPEHSEGAVPLYDPCAPGSRLGIRYDDLQGVSLDGISGLHWHTLCEQNSDALDRTLRVVEKKFAHLLEQVEYVNFGGGHHISRPDYNLDLLCECIERVRKRFGVEVYVEPGEAVALNAGVLVASVLDVVENDGLNAILDTSATAHMPDTLEMPYRPHIIGSGEAGEKAHTYRLGGMTCLAGDVIGQYSFDQPLKAGDRLVFTDMAHYTMVKTSFFNGVQHPAIATYDPETGHLEVLREFTYADFKNRLG
ncbi:MAG: carboxynorspermidine decarboxylase [Verrucomicrobiota bacterium JB022]|nr:carboxynorspermidine decarboxylase [Verrucomicrobiota bacterium JB022]